MRAAMSSVGNGGTRYAVRKMVSAAMADNGGTFNPATGERVNLTDGYMVGLGTGWPNYGDAVVLTPAEMYSDAGIDRILALLDIGGGMVEHEYIGAWRSGDVFVWEISRNFTRKELGLQMARIRSEYSIWDNANGTEILV